MTDSTAPSGQESQSAERESPVADPPRSDMVGLLRVGYRLAVRHLAALATPGALLYAPTGIAAWIAVVVAVGREGHIVNGDLTVWTYSPWLLGVLGAVLVIGYAVEVVVVAATVLMSAGLVLGRPVGARTALRAAVRRAPTLAVLGLVAAVMAAGAAAAGVVVVAKTGAVWLGVAVIVVIPLALLWLAVALPIALLEGAGPLRALARAGTVTRFHRWQTSIVVAAGAVVAPGVVVAGSRWAASPLDGIVHTLVAQVVLGVAWVVVVPFQAMTLAAVALNKRQPYRYGDAAERSIDVGAVAERLPAGPSGPRRRLWPLALVPLPGLLLAGYVWVNPLDLLRISDHVLRDDFSRQPVALHLLGGDRPVELSGPTGEQFGIRVCDTAACEDSRLYDYREGRFALHLGTGTLPDGTVAVAAWSPSPGPDSTREDGEWVLRLFRCGAEGCGTPQSVQTAPVIEHGGAGEMYGYRAAVTAAAGQGIVIAAVVPVEKPTEKRRDALLRIIRCPDVRCATPTAITATRLPVRSGLYNRPLAVTVGRGDRPVVAFEDDTTGGITMVSCDTAACAHPRVTREDLPRLPDDPGTNPYVDGVDIAVPPDDRPVVTHRDGRTGAALLRRCRTADCALTDTVTLTGPGKYRPWPALELDRAGRPIVATYDLSRHQAVIITCHDAGCARRAQVPIGQLDNGPGYLDLAIGRDGDPRVLWSDEPESLFYSNGPLHLTICRDQRCRQ